MKSKLAGLLLIALTVAVSVFLLKTKPLPQAKPQPNKTLTVDVVTLKKQDVSPSIRLTGRLEPVRVTELRFEVSGQVLERRVELGQTVRSSQTLFVVDDRDYRDALAQAQAEFDLVQLDLERDTALLDLAKQKTALQTKEVQRFAGLDQRKLSSRSQLDAARQKLLQFRTEQLQLENAIAASRARLQINRARLNLAKRNRLRTRVMAPYDGAVNAVHAEMGDYVNVAQPALALVDVSAFHFSVSVTGDAASILSIGDAVEVDIRAKKYPARVAAVQQVPDADTYAHEVLIRVSGGDLYAAMTGTVELPLPTQRGVFLVPSAALQYADGRRYLFVVDDHRILHRVEVSAGARLGDQVVVRGALRAGQNVAARASDSMLSGESVMVRRSAP